MVGVGGGGGVISRNSREMGSCASKGELEGDLKQNFLCSPSACDF